MCNTGHSPHTSVSLHKPPCFAVLTPSTCSVFGGHSVIVTSVSALLAPSGVKRAGSILYIVGYRVIASPAGQGLVFISPSACLSCKAALMHLFLLASLMPSLLAAMKSTSELVRSEVCLLSALAALHKVVETLPHFISPYLEGLLIQVGSGQL